MWAVVRHRDQVLGKIPKGKRLFVVETPRDTITLADMLSRNDIKAFTAALEERQLRPPDDIGRLLSAGVTAARTQLPQASIIGAA